MKRLRVPSVLLGVTAAASVADGGEAMAGGVGGGGAAGWKIGTLLFGDHEACLLYARTECRSFSAVDPIVVRCALLIMRI